MWSWRKASYCETAAAPSSLQMTFHRLNCVTNRSIEWDQREVWINSDLILYSSKCSTWKPNKMISRDQWAHRGDRHLETREVCWDCKTDDTYEMNSERQVREREREEIDRMCTSGPSSNTHWRLSVLHRDINRLWSTVLISCLRCSQASSAGCWRPATYQPASKPLPPSSQKPRATGLEWLQRCVTHVVCDVPPQNHLWPAPAPPGCGLQSQRVSRRCSKRGLHLTPSTWTPQEPLAQSWCGF